MTRSANSLSIIPHTEEAILRDAADDIANVVGRDATLIELGSEASRNVRLLFETVRPTSYLGMDITRDFLLDSTRCLVADYPSCCLC